ncbi:2-amino-4-hydroxy-6-hydroxymethyldihydropteridine diphosphokinase [Polaromonas jejuensis]|uniref:2-amino-4-hydroxy-6-hydroxymethyldihydropteridine pyrophosphokinase n=1 Tax=Polaromonas jejuensis TaxID=457502 RepID=A0ABW0Q4R1_9BURK|nr:2-amino-4-hydroxy-6-hydroxymethyldihydropteridine diphosphokinase [Polaromonas jejuensis]
MHKGEPAPDAASHPGWVSAYVALGANLGDAVAALRQALRAMQQLPLTQVRQASSLYKTAPLDTDSGSELRAPGADYFNAVVALETGLSAPALLDQLQQLEQQAGRERPYRNAPRTLDLDLLLYGSARMDSARLTLPHPRMTQRAFVLVPLAEIAPDQVSAEQLEAVSHQAITRLGPLAA